MQLINVAEFEISAKQRLAKQTFDYYASGASDELTVSRNIDALKRILLVPRILRDTSSINIKTQLLNIELPFPLFIAPTAFHALSHPEGEVETVKAANETGVPMIVSTMGTRSLEEIAQAATIPLWFQLYIYQERRITEQLVKRAEKAGYRALVVTVDTPIMGKREKDIRNGFKLPAGMSAKNFAMAGLTEVSDNENGSKVKNYTDKLFDKSLNWKDLDWLRSITHLPLIIKGIINPIDAELAVDSGLDAIIVSNHGGRQLDSMPASIEMLPVIADKVKNKIPLLIDGGFRRGTDLFKAIALGADAVLIGRPILWALSLKGRESIVRLLDIYRNEFIETMTLCGCNSIPVIKDDGWSIIKFA